MGLDPPTLVTPCKHVGSWWGQSRQHHWCRAGAKQQSSHAEAGAAAGAAGRACRRGTTLPQARISRKFLRNSDRRAAAVIFAKFRPLCTKFHLTCTKSLKLRADLRPAPYLALASALAQVPMRERDMVPAAGRRVILVISCM